MPRGKRNRPLKPKGTVVEEIIRKQCDMVGADYNDIKTRLQDQNTRWYCEYCWAPGQEEEFKKWLINYTMGLYQSEYHELTGSYYKPRSKKQHEKLAKEWLFQFGWSSTPQQEMKDRIRREKATKLKELINERNRKL